jgi:hypothetical protein
MSTRLYIEAQIIGVSHVRTVWERCGARVSGLELAAIAWRIIPMSALGKDDNIDQEGIFMRNKIVSAGGVASTALVHQIALRSWP